MKPINLPDTCPDCGAALMNYEWHGKHTHGWDIESASYKCWSKRHYNNATEIKALCPKSLAAKRADARADEIQRVVAAALNAAKATQEECESFSRAMDSGRYSSRREGVWLLLDCMKKGGR